MFLFIVGLLTLICAVGIMSLSKMLFRDHRAFAIIGGAALSIVSLIPLIWSTALYVNDNEGGIVVKKFGTDLPPNHIIATNGEKGPQANVLPPGWHFFYWPWLYDLEPVKNIEIPAGFVGVVTAKDGEPLLKGEIYAELWDDPSEMLDASKFLTGSSKNKKKGGRGPQLTVLGPGQYRYNPRQFSIKAQPALTVKVGEVVVIKANAGPIYEPAEGEKIELVNGVPMVPNGFRGIWRVALTPNQYYLHPDAYEKVAVRTTNRIYSYTGRSKLNTSDRPMNDNSINVRTKDGFEFPVDVRASAKISAESAPYVVAQLADPDSDPNKDGFDMLEEIVILPAIRAIFRNNAETRGALEYVASRSEIEKSSTETFKSKLAEFKVETDGLFVADIGLSKTAEGKTLLKTQTDKEVAQQEQETWAMKKLAAVARAESVRAEEEADQEKKKVESEVAIMIKENEGNAEAALAAGRAKAIRLEIDALGGPQTYIALKIAEQAMKEWGSGGATLPEILILGEGGGGESGLSKAVLSKMAQEMNDWKPSEKPVVEK